MAEAATVTASPANSPLDNLTYFIRGLYVGGMTHHGWVEDR